MKKTIQAAVLLVSLTSIGCRDDHPGDPITYRILLPDNYIGWVRVDFTGSASELDPHNRITLRVKDDGTCLTGSNLIVGTPTNYEFLYEKPEGLSPVRDDYVDHSLDAGGMTASGSHGISWFLFIGPKAYRDKHPSEQYSYSNLPKPGRMNLNQEMAIP